MRKAAEVFLIILLFLLLRGSLAGARAASVEEIRARYLEVLDKKSLLESPDLSEGIAPYEAVPPSGPALEAALAEANFIRWLAGIDSMELDEELTLRSRELYQEALGAIPAEMYRTTSNGQVVLTAKADAERRKADLEAELEKCTVTAPVSGVIISGSVREGQTVQKGAEDAKIVIAADHQYKIDIRVSQTYINDYREDQEVEIEIPAAGRTVKGKITKINPFGTKENDITFFTVTAQFEDTEEAEESEEEDGEDSSIYSGMNARVTAVLEKKQGVTAIPEDLIDSEGCVLVMRGGEPEKVKLETGICDQGMTEVTEGLSEGDTIVYQTGDTDST